jgi:preprotein translocase subunit SecY
VATNSAQIAKTGKYGDLRNRLVFLLLALVVYRVGAHTVKLTGIAATASAKTIIEAAGGSIAA